MPTDPSRTAPRRRARGPVVDADALIDALRSVANLLAGLAGRPLPDPVAPAP